MKPGAALDQDDVQQTSPEQSHDATSTSTEASQAEQESSASDATRSASPDAEDTATGRANPDVTTRPVTALTDGGGGATVLNTIRNNNVTRVTLAGVSIVALTIDGKERLCLAQISNTLLKEYSYNEIHNRRVALGITCVQCTPVQLEILRRAGAMPASSRRCGMITRREAERLVKSFLEDNAPPQLPDDFSFAVKHECGWGCHGQFIPSRYNSSRAKCIKCSYCNMYFSPNKFIFHYHRTADSSYRHPDAANFNSWRRHLYLSDPAAPDDLTHAWEDVKAMFNGGIRKRVHVNVSSRPRSAASTSPTPEKRPKVEQKSIDTLCSQPPFNCQDSFSKYKYPLNTSTTDFFPPKPRIAFPMSPPYPAIAMCEEGGKGPGAGPPGTAAGGTWSPTREPLYQPPYEMIWARHLGLTAPETGFALGSDQLPKPPGGGGSFPRGPLTSSRGVHTSPRKDPMPTPPHPRSSESRLIHSEPTGFKLYRPFDNVIEKSHLSAFKPVIASARLSPSAPIDFSMGREGGTGDSATETPREPQEDDDSDSEDEVLDVDTVDEQPINLSDAGSGERRLQQERHHPEQSVIKAAPPAAAADTNARVVADQDDVAADVMTTASDVDRRLDAMLDATTHSLRARLERDAADDELNNNNDHSNNSNNTGAEQPAPPPGDANDGDGK